LRNAQRAWGLAYNHDVTLTVLGAGNVDGESTLVTSLLTEAASSPPVSFRSLEIKHCKHPPETLRFLQQVLPSRVSALLRFWLEAQYQAEHEGGVRQLMFVNFSRVAVDRFDHGYVEMLESRHAWIGAQSEIPVRVLGVPDLLIARFPLDPDELVAEICSLLRTGMSCLAAPLAVAGDLFLGSSRFCFSGVTSGEQVSANELPRSCSAFETVLDNGLANDAVVRTLAAEYLTSRVARDGVAVFQDTKALEGFAAYLAERVEPANVLNRYWDRRWKMDRELQESFPFPESIDNFEFHRYIQRDRWSIRPARRTGSRPFSFSPHFERDVSQLSDDGFNVIGYFSRNTSLCTVAKRVSNQLDALGVPKKEIDFPWSPLSSPATRSERQTVHFRKNIWTTSASSLFTDLHASGSLSAGSWNIGYLFWETEHVPPRIVRSLRALDEIWAPTKFLKNVFEQALDRPVAYVPFPLGFEGTDGSGLDVSRTIGQPGDAIAKETDSRFVFGFMFDYLSGYERKNPEDVIRSFKLAFPHDSAGGPALLLKSRHGSKRPSLRMRLEAMLEDRSDIRLVDDEWSETQMERFWSEISCYVSLHRAEGLGLPLEQAMNRGIPVICTNYGGVSEFGNGELTLGVSWAPVAANDSAGFYGPSAHWAQPSVSEAAIRMKQLVAGKWIFDRDDWVVFANSRHTFVNASWRSVCSV